MRLAAASSLLVAAMWTIAVGQDSDRSVTRIVCGVVAGTAAYWGVVLIATYRRGGPR